MTAQHPMSDALRIQRDLAFRSGNIAAGHRFNDAADALDAMQARCDALEEALQAIKNEARPGQELVISEAIDTLAGCYQAAHHALGAERAHRESGS